MNLIFSLLTALLLLTSTNSSSTAITNPSVLHTDMIKSFTQEIFINKDGTLTITEDIIAYKGRGNKIKRGVYRDLKTLNALTNSPQSYSIIKVMRDGNEIPFTESKDGFLSLADKPGNHRIYMGDMNIYLESNKDYHYQLTYTTTTQIIPSGGIDILHYNIDGANWDLPMAQVTSIIHAPSRIKNHSFNQRRYHNDTQPLISQSLDLDETTITTTTNLPNPNLAVKFEFDPGFIQLSIWQKFTNLQQNNPWQFFGFFAILQLIIYAFLYIRTKNSITPHYSETPTIVQYYPPKDISPALSIAIMNSFTALTMRTNALLLPTIYISLANKGLLKIKQTKTKVLFISATKIVLIKQFNVDNITLPAAEKIVYDMLWLDSEFAISKSNYSLLEQQSQRAALALTREFKRAYFIPTPPAVYRLAAFGLLMAPLNWFTIPTFTPEGLLLAYFLMFWMLPITLPAFSYLKRRTQVGKDAASHLKGLEKFILSTESNKFKIDPPPISPEYHNLILPYAVALGCDSQWSDYLKDPINSAITRSHQSDSYISNRHIGTSSIASSISSAVAVSAPSNSSSGGDGGGGA
jgi:hypothetical protein